jgi:hypothetical protein
MPVFAGYAVNALKRSIRATGATAELQIVKLSCVEGWNNSSGVT